MEDRILVKKCKRGDKYAFQQIYSKYRNYLLVLAVALSNDSYMAEDALHDVFVAFAKRMQDFRLTGSLKAYLAACVANRVRDLLKKHNRANVALTDNCPETAADSDPGRRISCNEQLGRLAKALEQLPIEQRQTIALHIHSRMTFREIGKSMGISVNTVKGRYRYGIEKLRSALNVEVQK